VEHLFGLIVTAVLLALGFFIGRSLEKSHYKSIRQREASLRRVVVLPVRFPNVEGVTQQFLVTGSVVISVDYFKRFLAVLKMFFGGRLTSYESLLDRARREAVLRLQDQARRKGAYQVYNLRFETSSISKGEGNNVGSIEVLAYGTALRTDNPT
jgi:uncharacterized protein YbjQ (UPF0145 family)